MKQVKTKQTNKLTGVISISSKGTGYVQIGETKVQGEDPEIDFRHLNTALHGDTVEIVLHPKGKGRQTAEVTKIIERAKMSFAGVLEQENGLFFLNPDDTKMYTDILIPEKDLAGAKSGDKVFGAITSWEDRKKSPIGKIIKVLGLPGDNNAEMHAIAMEKGFEGDFPPQVENEAKAIKQRGIKPEDYEGRKDFRKTLTFTIDPYDAKDFDDAISFQILKTSPQSSPERRGSSFPFQGKAGDEVYEIGIHIADVSYYLKEGSELDREAKGRGTSVYLVDRTIPMLPEALSNDLCSLVPYKDRLAMSAVFIMDKKAKVLDEWYGRTIINSQTRFTYEEAEESIKKAGLPLHKELAILNTLAKKLTKERFAKGAISLEADEVKFVLDKNGVPLKVMKKERGDSNRLIEEFMLLANRRVAEKMTPDSKKGNKRVPTKIGTPTEVGAFVYRIHDLPSKEKMVDLAFFLKSLGHKVSLKDGIIPSHEINKLLENLALNPKENTMKDTVHRAVIRSMAKAIYSTQNIGHYGLAFEYYTHFTSPIRRYPDVIVHRLLNDFLAHKKFNKDKIGEYQRMSMKASEQEKRAAEAERASIKYKQVEYMSKRLGEKFEGIISGLTEWGIYVEEKETKCEGLVRVRDMSDDFYVFNEKKLELIGQKKKKSYRLGDKVKIKVKSVDLERKTIDYVLV